MTISKTDLFASLKDIQADADIPDEFRCLGTIDQVYPEYQETDYYYYRTWIWENGDGIRIATWDLNCSQSEFMCEGTLEGLNTYFAELEKSQREAVASAGDIVMFSKNSDMSHIPNLRDASYRVESVEEAGIKICGFEQVFPHPSYIIC